MENLTMLTPLKNPVVFELVGFYVPPGSGPLFFCMALIAYLLTLLANGVVAGVILIDKSLHRPMFIMICHLVVCNVLGATTMLPCLMVHFLTGQRKVSHAIAIIQALCLHTYGAAMQTILAVMAYDRYVAVCNPLRYATIMTSTRLHICCSLAWIVSLLVISVLFFFHINIQLCGKIIQDVYSSNRGILSLACIPTPINNIYGLTLTWTLSTSVFLIIAFSYMRILRAGIKRDKKGFTVNTKPLRTCATHLVVYLFYRIAALIIIVSLRFPSLSPNVKKFCSILFIVVPPAINPVIYGLISKELRASIIKQLSTRGHK
ncbi:olfactory receptor 52E4-like [Takifugu rubripes]|uniref:olfactory receptor 52E4-like n=1 Tax=Takifugu rubripes TaxID=31033 RepID=UPI0011458157|nr:olfactory receptor 52E4-like [Takifugu rubripes]